MNRELAANAVMDALKAYNAFQKWMDWCAGLNEAKKAAGLYAMNTYGSPAWVAQSAAVERQYMMLNKRPTMPSERRKGQMYDAAYRAARCVDMDLPAGSINDLEGVFRTISHVAAVLAVA